MVAGHNVALCRAQVARNVLGAGCGALFARAPPPQQPILLSQLPLHLQMTAHILEASFRGFRDASVVRYTFAGCPSWLAQVRRSLPYAITDGGIAFCRFTSQKSQWCYIACLLATFMG